MKLPGPASGNFRVRCSRRGRMDFPVYCRDHPEYSGSYQIRNPDRRKMHCRKKTVELSCSVPDRPGRNHCRRMPL